MTIYILSGGLVCFKTLPLVNGGGGGENPKFPDVERTVALRKQSLKIVRNIPNWSMFVELMPTKTKQFAWSLFGNFRTKDPFSNVFAPPVLFWPLPLHINFVLYLRDLLTLETS